MRPGTVIADRFELSGDGLEGGMGTVFRARDRSTGKDVALKLLRIGGAEERQRFEREADLLAEVNHPSVARFISRGLTADGVPFLVMDWISGTPLSKLLRTSGLSVPETLSLARQLTQGLSALHALGVVHRDVKPSNVLVNRAAGLEAKLVDLGVARRMEQLGPTKTGVMVGSMGYMSPEQARGQWRLTPAADFFSLGCVLYECLGGRPAFRGPDPVSVRAQILIVEPPSLAAVNESVSPRLADVVRRLMSKAPAARLGTGAEVLDALADLDEADSGPVARLPSVAPVPVSSTAPTNTQTNHSGPHFEAGVPLCLLMVGAPVDELPAQEEERRVRDCEALATEFGATCQRLDGGWLLLSLRGDGSLERVALAGANLAEKLRARLPDAAMTMSVLRGSTGLSDAINALAVELQQEQLGMLFTPADPSALSVRVDPLGADSLRRHFIVQERNAARYLAGRARG